MFQTMRSPINRKAVDILMYVGSEYSVPQYIREAEAWGASKRLPATGVPDGIVPGVSRMFLWHSEVIPLVWAEGKTLKDLSDRLVEMGKLDRVTVQTLELDKEWHPENLLLPASYVPPGILRLTCILQDLPERRDIEKEFGIVWQGAVFSWSPIEIQYVVGKDGKVPDEVANKYGSSIRYVRVSYDKEWKNEPEA